MAHLQVSLGLHVVAVLTDLVVEVGPVEFGDHRFDIAVVDGRRHVVLCPERAREGDEEDEREQAQA